MTEILPMKGRYMQDWKPKRGFTLIELLVVVAIIVVLLSILLPSLRDARESAKNAVCKSNLRSCNMALQIYGYDYNNVYPPAVRDASADVASWATWYMWHRSLIDQNYLPKTVIGKSHVTICPSFAPRVMGTDSSQVYGLWMGDQDHGSLAFKNGATDAKWWYFYINRNIVEPDRVLLADSTREGGGVPQYGTLDNGNGLLGASGNKAIHLRHPGNTANAAFIDGSVLTINKSWIVRDKRFYFSERTSEQ